MTLKGKEGLQELEIGTVQKGVKRLINSVWTVEFVPTRDGVVIIKYDRKDPEGYDREKELPQANLLEDDSRTVTGLVISDPKSASFQDNKNTDTFEVLNPKHIFSYDGNPTNDELNHPDLMKIKHIWKSKNYGLSENKMQYLVLFEDFARKKYMEPMKLSDFEKIPKGSSVMYMGAKYKVEDNNGAILTLKDEKGQKRIVNLGMFNYGGGIFDDTNK